MVSDAFKKIKKSPNDQEINEADLERYYEDEFKLLKLKKTKQNFLKFFPEKKYELVKMAHMEKKDQAKPKK